MMHHNTSLVQITTSSKAAAVNSLVVLRLDLFIIFLILKDTVHFLT